MLAIKETAIVKNHKLEIYLPADFADGQVEVFILQNVKKEPKAPKNELKQALNDLAACNGALRGLDPVEWQKENRADNLLPGRE